MKSPGVPAPKTTNILSQIWFSSQLKPGDTLCFSKTVFSTASDFKYSVLLVVMLALLLLLKNNLSTNKYSTHGYMAGIYKVYNTLFPYKEMI